MPAAPLPPHLERFVREPRPAVIGTVRPDGSPATTATWYELTADGLLFSIVSSSPRHRNLRLNPKVSLTILGESWYDHVSLWGSVTTLRADPSLDDLDALSQRYYGTPYPNRQLDCVTAIARLDRWHAWGDPGRLEPTG